MELRFDRNQIVMRRGINLSQTAVNCPLLRALIVMMSQQLVTYYLLRSASNVRWAIVKSGPMSKEDCVSHMLDQPKLPTQRLFVVRTNLMVLEQMNLLVEEGTQIAVWNLTVMI